MESIIYNFVENHNLRKIYLSNENILKKIFNYCSISDILNLSLVSKKFNKITKQFDYMFKHLSNKTFFSNYENYK